MKKEDLTRHKAEVLRNYMVGDLQVARRILREKFGLNVLRPTLFKWVNGERGSIYEPEYIAALAAAIAERHRRVSLVEPAVFDMRAAIAIGQVRVPA